MSFYKRIKATLTAQMDDMVSQIENHEAVIDSALVDAKRKVAHSKVKLSRLQHDRKSCEEKQHQQKAHIAKWEQRAIDSQQQEGDQQKALECMQRRKVALERLDELTDMLKQLLSAERRLQTDIESATRKIEEMSRKKQLMAARESTADTLKSLHSIEGCINPDVDQSFDRWEARILTDEMEGDLPSVDEVDEFEQAFVSEEDQADLLNQLNALVDNRANVEQPAD